MHFTMELNGCIIKQGTSNKAKDKKMYTDKLDIAVRGLDILFDELVKMANKNHNKYCTNIIDVDNFVDTSKPCTCHKKGRTLFNGGILDDIDQVIFNDPATIVTFKDGTKVCVKASEHDPFCKETGLVYAIIKRLYANDVDENGYLKSTGLGERINQIVKSAFDQKEQEKAIRAKRKAKAERKAKEAKAKENLANEVSEQAAKEACEAPVV